MCVLLSFFDLSVTYFPFNSNGTVFPFNGFIFLKQDSKCHFWAFRVMGVHEGAFILYVCVIVYCMYDVIPEITVNTLKCLQITLISSFNWDYIHLLFRLCVSVSVCVSVSHRHLQCSWAWAGTFGRAPSRETGPQSRRRPAAPRCCRPCPDSVCAFGPLAYGWCSAAHRGTETPGPSDRRDQHLEIEEHTQVLRWILCNATGI